MAGAGETSEFFINRLCEKPGLAIMAPNAAHSGIHARNLNRESEP